MVLESLLDLKTLRKRPWDTFFLSVFYSAVGTILAYLTFPSEVSIAMVFLTTMAHIPILVNLLKKEEREQILFGKPFVKTHTDILAILFFTFMGMLTFFTFLAVILPEEMFSHFFSRQVETIRYINTLSAAATSPGLLEKILINNFKVLFFVIIFSFLYGAGAIFILTWNASVLGTAIGDAIRDKISLLGPGFASYFKAVPLAFGMYMIHGIIEVVAYFMGAVAGGIISAAVVRHDYRSPKFMEVLLDSVDMIILASMFLILAGLVEVLI